MAPSRGDQLLEQEKSEVELRKMTEESDTVVVAFGSVVWAVGWVSSVFVSLVSLS